MGTGDTCPRVHQCAVTRTHLSWGQKVTRASPSHAVWRANFQMCIDKTSSPAQAHSYPIQAPVASPQPHGTWGASVSAYGYVYIPHNHHNLAARGELNPDYPTTDKAVHTESPETQCECCTRMSLPGYLVVYLGPPFVHRWRTDSHKTTKQTEGQRHFWCCIFGTKSFMVSCVLKGPETMLPRQGPQH